MSAKPLTIPKNIGTYLKPKRHSATICSMPFLSDYVDIWQVPKEIWHKVETKEA
jgi:hypothetical protein